MIYHHLWCTSEERAKIQKTVCICRPAATNTYFKLTSECYRNFGTKFLQTCSFLHALSEAFYVPFLAEFYHLSLHSQCVALQGQIWILFHQEWYWCLQQYHEEWLPYQQNNVQI